MLRFAIFVLLLLVWGCSEASSFKFALFSDTHIIENSTAIEDLEQVVEDVNQNSDLEFVLVSGDITEINTGRNLEIAKDILDKLNKPYYIIPGNHDTKWSGSGGANFRALWGDDKFVFDYGKYRFIGFHQGPVLRMDDGHISLETLDWLKKILIKTGKKTPIILVMHYDLTSSVDNWFECVEIIKDYNIIMTLHGHGHRNRLKYYNNIPGLMGRSTLRARSTSAGYTIFEFRDDSLFAYEKKTDSEEKMFWEKISLNRKNEISLVSDSLLPDYSINQTYTDVKIKWLFNSGYTMTASPVYDENNVYVGDISGTLNSLDKLTGEILWQFKANEAIYGTAAINDDYLVFTAADSSIYCLDKNSGDKLWNVKTKNALVSVPAIDNETIYVGSSDGIFRALNLETGAMIWKFSGIKGYVESRPLVYKKKVIFPAWDGKLYALDQFSGELIWSWQGPMEHSLYSPAACWPVAAHNKIFIAAPDRYVSAINAETGETIWRNNHWKFRETVGISENGKFIYARSMTDSVVAFFSSDINSKVKWAENFDYGYDIAPSMPMEKNGTVFWGTKNGLIIAADSKSGNIKWKYKFQNYLINTVCPVDESNLLFSNIDGYVGIVFDTHTN